MNRVLVLGKWRLILIMMRFYKAGVKLAVISVHNCKKNWLSAKKNCIQLDGINHSTIFPVPQESNVVNIQVKSVGDNQYFHLTLLFIFAYSWQWKLSPIVILFSMWRLWIVLIKCPEIPLSNITVHSMLYWPYETCIHN